MTRLALAALLVLACRSESGSGSPPPAPAPEGKAPAVSREDCAAILDKADRLMGHDSTTHPRDPVKREREIDECVANATPAALECAKAATTYAELDACEKR